MRPIVTDSLVCASCLYSSVLSLVLSGLFTVLAPRVGCHGRSFAILTCLQLTTARDLPSNQSILWYCPPIVLLVFLDIDHPILCLLLFLSPVNFLLFSKSVQSKTNFFYWFLLTDVILFQFSLKPNHFITARCYASAVLEMGLCPSVCLSVCHKSVFY